LLDVRGRARSRGVGVTVKSPDGLGPLDETRRRFHGAPHAVTLFEPIMADDI